MAHACSIPPSCARLQRLAERHPGRAAALAARALALATTPPAARAWARYTYGWALLCWERVEAARTQLQLANADFAAQALNDGVLRCRFALLLADQMQLSRPQLDHEFAHLAAELQMAGMALDAARCQLEHARHLNALGRPRDAEALLDQCAPALAHGTPIDLARADRVRGNAANARNDFTRAAALLTRAAGVFAAAHYPIDAAKCELDRAWLALRQEQLDLADAGYARAGQVFTRLDLPLHQAFYAKNMSLVLAKRGAYKQALHASLTALTHFMALGRTADIGASHLHLGNLYYYIGCWDAALACYRRAEQVYGHLGMDGYHLIAQRNRAMVYRCQGRPGEAAALLELVEARARTLDNQIELAEARAIQAALLAEAGSWARAAAWYGEARAIFARHQNLHAVAECELELGWIALAQHDLAAALAAFQAAAPATQQHPHDRWRVDYGLARCAELRGEPQAALALYQSASATVGTLRHQLASEATSSALFAQAAQMHADALRLALGQGDYATALALHERQRALILQRALRVRPAASPLPEPELAALRARLAPLMSDAAGTALFEALVLEYAAAHAAGSAQAEHLPETSLDLSRLRAHLQARFGQEWTALIYIVDGQTLWIGMLTAEQITFSTTPYDAELQSFIQQATHQIYRSYTYRDFPYLQGATNQPWQRLRALSDRLLPAALQRRLHAEHRLLLVPAAALHALPWAALRLGAGWLVEQAQLQVLPSLAVWEMLATRPPADRQAVLFIGCQTFGDRAPPLPGVSAEQLVVAQHWRDPVILHERQASRTSLIERSQQGDLRRYGLIHVASHAQLTPAHGQAAHLKLSDADLLLGDIARLDLAGCLVVLSACDGAAADVLPGEEVYSLSWALLAAGARGVVASQWPIGDQAVIALIEHFYAELQNRGDAVAALACAQRALGARPAADPTGWGSFLLVGEG